MIVRTIHTDYGLDPETERTYRVRAQNEPKLGMMDVSEESEHASATTDEAVAPDAPTGVTATAASDMSITLNWTAPDDPEGAPVTGYMVESAYEMSDGTMSDWMAVDPAHDGTDTMYTDMNLTAETKYYYRVAAVNSVDTGAWSDGMANATTSMTPTAPMVSGTAIADVPMTVGDAAATRDASVAFTEADGDAVTYDAKSSNTAAATVSVTGSTISIMAVAAGESTVSVTATDKDGTSDPVTFMVMVEAAAPTNNAPTAVGSIDAVTITAGMSSDAMDVSGNFNDPDGDALTYTAMSDNTDAATVSVDGSMVTITGVAHGSATITVTATDPAGESVEQEIMVTVEAVRRAPNNVLINPVGSGLVNVDWEPVPGAQGYYIVAAENVVGGSVHSVAVNGGDSRLGALGGLTKDVEYLMFVGAFFTLEDYVLEYQRTILAE